MNTQTIPAPAVVKSSLIDISLIHAAGEPGTAARVAVYHALQILALNPCWQAGGRGPHSYDWLGFIRAVVSDTMESVNAQMVPLEDHRGFPASHERGLDVTTAANLFMIWGLKPRPALEAQPGDIILFSMPSAHAGVVIARPDTPMKGWARPPLNYGLMAHADIGCPPKQTWIGPNWAERAGMVFTWA